MELKLILGWKETYALFWQKFHNDRFSSLQGNSYKQTESQSRLCMSPFVTISKFLKTKSRVFYILKNRHSRGNHLKTGCWHANISFWHRLGKVLPLTPLHLPVDVTGLVASRGNPDLWLFTTRSYASMDLCLIFIVMSRRWIKTSFQCLLPLSKERH